MTVSSIHGGIVPFDTSIYGSESSAVNAAVYRDGPLNGALHLQDSLGQTRVNFMVPSGSSPLEPENVETNVYSPIITLGPLPLLMGDDGGSYKLRGKIWCASSGGANCTFSLSLELPSSPGAWVGVDADWVAEINTTSTAPDTNGAPFSLELPPSQAYAWMQTISTTDGVGGNAASYDGLWVAVSVYADTKAASTSTPQFYGLHLSEYY